MQISNNQTNLNFNGAFKIKPSELKAQTEIPALFTQGMQNSQILKKKAICLSWFEIIMTKELETI